MPGGYLRDFAALVVACDLAATAMLVRKSTAAAWYWICAVPLLGSFVLVRFDMVPVALAVAALCATHTSTGRGALIGIGAAIKVWPVTMLAGTPPGQWRRTITSGATAAGVICVLLIGGAPSFLGHQNARGVEVESLVATPFLIWRQFGWPGQVAFRYGAMELDGTGVAVAEYVSVAAMVLALAGFVIWRRRVARRWRPEFGTDAPLAATLLFLVTNPVLSAQFLLWLIGVAAACLAVHPRRTTQRPVAVAVLVAAGLTQLVFPVGWLPFLHGSALVTSVLILRNVVLLAATILSCQRLLRASQRRSANSENRDEIAQQGERHGQRVPVASAADERRSGFGRDEDRDQA
jgi:hypothetical protein